MPCYRPLQGYRGRVVNASGKSSLVFGPEGGRYGFPVTIPCGRCIGCRLERSRQWAIRLVHEGSLHEEKCFLTLTYDPAHYPPDGSLDVAEFQRFMKRLRKRVAPTKLRFFHCGEYGERLGRPHYHCILFGFSFPDKKLFRRGSEPSLHLYTSELLSELWPLGFSTIGQVTFESAAYVARYVVKKWLGPGAAEHYSGRKPEYTTMSRRPGIGSAWLEKFQSDVFPADEVVLRGRKMAPPKFYRQRYELLEPEQAALLKLKRGSVGAEAQLDEGLVDRENLRSNPRARARIRVREDVAVKRGRDFGGRHYEDGTP